MSTEIRIAQAPPPEEGSLVAPTGLCSNRDNCNITKVLSQKIHTWDPPLLLNP
jgi:hypothetical protein